MTTAPGGTTATTAALPAAAPPLPGVRPRPGALTLLLRNRKARLGGLLLLLLIGLCVGAPFITPQSPTEQNVRAKFTPPVFQAGGSWEHPLGTDNLGRDVLARILHGGQLSLQIGLLATAAAAVIGIGLGVLAGYAGGGWDAACMRLADVQLAFPSILLALAVMVMLGPSFVNLILVLAVTSWVFFSRVVRADVLMVKSRDFVEAGRAIGAPETHLVLHYILPNLIGTITVVATLTVARTIIAEASLSFLGLGIQPPTPSWGQMLAEGRRYLSVAWWGATFPGLALMLTIVAINLLGDALRDVLDPRLRGAAD